MSRIRKAALATATAAVLVAGANALPSAAQDPPPPPIATEFLTGRAVFADDVGLKLKVKLDDKATTVVNTTEPSRTVVARFTVQPGAQFPWHSHAGPVVVNVVAGEDLCRGRRLCGTRLPGGHRLCRSRSGPCPHRLQRHRWRDGVGGDVLQRPRRGAAAHPGVAGLRLASSEEPPGSGQCGTATPQCQENGPPRGPFSWPAFVRGTLTRPTTMLGAPAAPGCRDGDVAAGDHKRTRVTVARPFGTGSDARSASDLERGRLGCMPRVTEASLRREGAAMRR